MTQTQFSPAGALAPRSSRQRAPERAGLLAACGGSTSAATTTSGAQKLAKTLHFSNWTLYIDTNKKTNRHPSLDEFKKKTGTHVDYTRTSTTTPRSSGRSRDHFHAGSRSTATSSS